MTMRFLAVASAILLSSSTAFAWISSSSSSSVSSVSSPQQLSTFSRKQEVVSLHASNSNYHTTTNNQDNPSVDPQDVVSATTTTTTRRHFFTAATAAAATPFLLLSPPPANALVKGNAPPPKKSSSSDKPKCTNVEECQAMAEKKAQEEREEEERNMVPPEITKGGVRYRDMDTPAGIAEHDAAVVQQGDEVTIYYKVLKLGKRSFDGLSGEGTVVFSRGYGLEDDEKEAGSKTFVTTVGSPQNIVALNDALVGMKVGGLRRFSILPQQGWEKATKTCDGGPGGSGAGGELKTDYVVVPTATMVATEECLDKTKLPFPTTYAQQRRMAQRFDQSLIMEVQVVKTGPSPF